MSSIDTITSKSISEKFDRLIAEYTDSQKKVKLLEEKVYSLRSSYIESTGDKQHPASLTCFDFTRSGQGLKKILTDEEYEVISNLYEGATCIRDEFSDPIKKYYGGSEGKNLVRNKKHLIPPYDGEDGLVAESKKRESLLGSIISKLSKLEGVAKEKKGNSEKIAETIKIKE